MYLIHNICLFNKLEKKESSCSYLRPKGVAKKPRSTTGTICKHCLRNHLSKREEVELIKQAPSSMTLEKKSLLDPPTTVP
jgi:hypothetical protein